MFTFLNLCDKNKNAFSIAKIYLDYELYNKVECLVAKEFNSKRMKLMSLACLFVSSLAGYLSCPSPPHSVSRCTSMWHKSVMSKADLVLRYITFLFNSL